MYVKQLEIDNFKSFATKVDIPLLKGFTTVSGPNGSGKSNILDSILFALGLSGTRALRAENVSHLISTFNKRNEAYVKVTFSEVGDYGDFSVARRIRKASNGTFSSIYYLNDKVTTLTEIHAVLEQFNLTSNSYNIIMQGDVTSIIKCNPTDRRKLIDEIAGVADFDRRIDQAKGELDTVEQRVESSTLILNEKEEHLKQLEEEKEIAQKYQKLKDEKTSYESQINAVRYFDIKRNLEKAHENILEFGKKKKVEESNKIDLEEKLNLIQGKYNELAAELKEKGEDKRIELIGKKEESKGRIENKKNAINYTEKQILDSAKSIENKKNGIEEQKKNIKDNELKIELKQEEIKALQDNILDKKAELNKILAEKAGLDETASKFMENHAAYRSELSALQEKENNLLKEKYPKEARLSSLKSEVEKAENEVQKLNEFKENFSSNEDKIKVQHEELGKELEELKHIQKTTMEELDNVKDELTDTQYNFTAAVRKLESLKAQKSASEMANSNGTIEAVMRANLRGVHAPLSQLGKVDKEYATALEVAVGGRMAHIVVDDYQVALRAVELLKSANAGRATFIPLNKIKPAPDKLTLPRDKGVIDFAINLIDFDDQYLDAFYYAVGETLVVEDNEVAQNLKGKYRVVTISGEIYEKSGSLTGGSLKANRMKFSQTDDEELEKANKKLGEIEAKLATLNSKKAELEEKLDKTRITYSNSQSEYTKTGIELQNLLRSNADKDSALNEKLEYITKTKTEIEQLEKVLDKEEEKHIELSEKITEVQTKINELENLMNDDELKKLKAQTEDVENEIKRLYDKINNINMDINEIQRKNKFDESVMESRYDEISNLEKNIKTLEEDKATYEKEIQTLNEGLKDLEYEIEKISEVLDSLLKEKSQIEEDLLNIKEQKRKSETEIEKLAEQIESFKARRRELEPEFKTAETELIESGVKISELEPVTISIDEINAKIQRLQKKMDELGDVNMRAIAQYDAISERVKELKTQIETLTKERLQILERMEGYEQLKKEAFLKAYNGINIHFKEVFHELSDGEGTLVLGNPEDPLNGGLTIDAQPRDKQRQRLESMSGGEQTLTALSFVFAIQRYLPAPFYALDEVDASLDNINVEKLAHLVKKQSENTQFIVVSHRPPMIESANRTIGVTQKEKGKTKVTGIKLEED